MSIELINSESDLREYLKNMGFAVNEKHENDNSIDIVAIKNGRYFLIEVKKAILDGKLVRVRSESANEYCDFILVIGLNGIVYPKEIPGKPYSKIINFMELL
jgi:Holliday junction resolvase